MRRRLRLPLLMGLLALAALGADSAETPGGIATLVFLLSLALGVAKLGGALAERFGQPSVLGELLAGVAVGPSVLGRLAPLSIDPAQPAFHFMAEIGVVLLLFEIGLETDVKDLARSGRSSLLVALIGVIVPFALGWFSVHLLARAGLLDVHPDTVGLLAVFLGATLTATSVGITGRVLKDLNRMHSPEARVLIGAAVLDDVLGLVVLAVVMGLGAAAATGTALSDAVSPMLVVKQLATSLGFLVGAVVLGRLLAPLLFNFVDRLRVRGALLVAAVSFALLMAAGAGLAGSALIIGGFAAGLALSEVNQFDEIEASVKPVVDVFSPIFFVIVGAAVDVSVFDVREPGNRATLLLAAVLLLVAVVGKIVAGLGVVERGVSRIVVGVGMIPRGEVGLIFAQAGYLLVLPIDGGVRLLDASTYAAVTLMIMLTTFITPPVLRALSARQDRAAGPPAGGGTPPPGGMPVMDGRTPPAPADPSAPP